MSEIGTDAERDDGPHYRRLQFCDRRKLHQKNRLNEADRRGLEAVTEIELPVASGDSGKVETIRLHGFDHCDLGGTMPRLRAQKERTMGNALHSSQRGGDPENHGGRHRLQSSAEGPYAPGTATPSSR